MTGDPKEVICNCNNVTRGEIEKAVLEKGLRDIDEISEYLKAGIYCGACLEDIHKIVDEVVASESKS